MIQVAVGEAPDLSVVQQPEIAAVRFVLNNEDKEILAKLEKEHSEFIVLKDVHEGNAQVTDSSTRMGVCLMHAKSVEDLIPYLPKQMEE